MSGRVDDPSPMLPEFPLPQSWEYATLHCAYVDSVCSIGYYAESLN